MSTGLFFVRRDSTWMIRRISSSRPMTGSILPARGLGEVAAVLLERLVLLFGVVARDPVRAAHLAQRVEHRVARDAERAHEVADATGDVGHREQQVLGREVLVVELRALLVGRSRAAGTRPARAARRARSRRSPAAGDRAPRRRGGAPRSRRRRCARARRSRRLRAGRATRAAGARARSRCARPRGRPPARRRAPLGSCG